MVQAIIAENEKKYHQCENTCPFLLPPLRQQFGAYGETTATEQVLSGSLKAPSTNNDLSQLFLDVCTSTNTPTSMLRSVSQFKDSWKKMQENLDM